MLNDVLCIVLITTTLMAIIEKDTSFVYAATFALITLLTGIILVSLFAIFGNRRLKIQELVYKGNLTTLIEELRYSGLYFHKQIGSVYIFSTKRLLSRNVRLLVTKEQKDWRISCDEYSFKSVYNSLRINLSIEKKVFNSQAKTRNTEVGPSSLNNRRN
jgi:hypothetical protein